MRAAVAGGDDLELDYLKRRYLHDFEGALRDAFAALPERDRAVNRYYYGHGLGIDAIGAIYRVHRSTAARWVNGATDSLILGTRRLLMDRLGANRSEVSSIVRLLQSRLNTIVHAIAAGVPEPKPQ
jgi:RNA polymerase sigma-70 factor (ECF subfamily)